MKKKTIILITAMVLALAIVTGSTLAYLTSVANKVTNTFVSGGFGVLSLQEVNDDGDKDIAWFTGTKTGDNYTNSYDVVPGVDIKKDPQVKFEFDADSVATGAYVFVKITYPTSDSSNGWTYVASTNGINAKLTGKINDVDALSVTFANNWKVVGAGTSKGTIVLTYCTNAGSIKSMKPTDNPLKNASSLFKALEGGDKTIDVSDVLTEADLDVFVTKTANYNLSFSAYAIQTDGFTGDQAVADAWKIVKSK
jgi:predicted ribosomally synthesized peptide with SipW-like signal peptide